MTLFQILRKTQAIITSEMNRIEGSIIYKGKEIERKANLIAIYTPQKSQERESTGKKESIYNLTEEGS